jgi:hypothetical protein
LIWSICLRSQRPLSPPGSLAFTTLATCVAATSGSTLESVMRQRVDERRNETRIAGCSTGERDVDHTPRLVQILTTGRGRLCRFRATLLGEVDTARDRGTKEREGSTG